MKRLAALALLAALVAASPALACTCLQRTEEQIIAEAEVVVVGTVTDVRHAGQRGSGTIIATIDVMRIVKGRVHRQIQVRTRDNPAACGVDFTVGASVRVAANKLNDGLNTNLCMVLRW